MRIVLPTEEEHQAWLEHPVTQFVAKAYGIMADEQRAAWQRLFDGPVSDPAKLADFRLELKTREDAYRAFMETTFARYLSVVDPEAGALLASQSAPATGGLKSPPRHQNYQRRAQPRQNRGSAA